MPAPPEQEAAIREHEAAIAELESRLKATRAHAGGVRRAQAAQSPSPTFPASSWTTRRPRKSASGGPRSTRGATWVPATSTIWTKGKGEDPDVPAEIPRTGRYDVWLAYVPHRESGAVGPSDRLQRRRREDRSGRHAGGPGDRRPVPLARAISLRAQRPGLCLDLERRDKGTRRRRCRALHPRGPGRPSSLRRLDRLEGSGATERGEGDLLARGRVETAARRGAESRTGHVGRGTAGDS